MTHTHPWSPIRYQDAIRGAIASEFWNGDDPRPIAYRPLHGGLGDLGFAVATSSGQTNTDLPSCH
jgi:hypothetical protein